MSFKKAIIVITAISAAIMELIDTSIVNVALNDISGNLGATIEDTSWVITAYAIANVIIIPMTGFLARYFGRKNYYVGSIILFTVASWLCGQSGSLGELVLWRFIQGIGGGALLSTSQAIVFDNFPPEKRGMAAALFGMGVVMGPTLGPILGGVIVENYHWELIFDINIPFGILATILAVRFLDKKPEEYGIKRKEISIDYTGILLLAVGIGSLQYVLERGEADDWFTNQNIRILSLTALVGLVGFVWRELTTPEPMIDLRILRSRNLVASNILNFVVGFGLFGSVFIFPVLVQRVMGYSPTEAGLGLVPGALAALVLMPVIGRNLSKGVSPLVFVSIGFAAFLIHGYTSSLATIDSPRSFFIIPQILRGIGTACIMIPMTNQAVIGLKPKEMPYGIALSNMLRQLGGAFGIAVMNTYVNQRYAVHRYDLVSNLQSNDPELISRMQQYSSGLIARGINPASAETISNRLLDATVSKSGYMLAYLDSFLLISLFFICAIPLMFLLKRKKMNPAEAAKVAAEAH